MFIETWTRTYCCKCGRPNWNLWADLSDPLGCDIDGVQCWYCSHCYLLAEEESLYNDEVIYDLGRYSPL